ncbi:hypothetical protein B0T14DRAFT_513574 [Immersiella caudata]|uniref:Uncharacterized protein n=1 Tax=Immersiella caudata TaxID=314043 RepID=A0AA39X6B0_9PEZI|nr:hypothetical protein B0T14DRAFT_513574 [Immersiella caudata]
MYSPAARSAVFLCLWTIIALILFTGIRYQHMQAGYAPGYPRKPRCENQRLARSLDSCQFRCPGGSCEAKEMCDERGCVTKYECDCNKEPPPGPIYSKRCNHNEVHSAGGICASECAYGTCVTNRYFFCSPTCRDRYRCDCGKKPRIMGCFHGQEYLYFDQCDVNCDGGSCEANWDYCDDRGCLGQFKCTCSKKPKYEGDQVISSGRA